MATQAKELVPLEETEMVLRTLALHVGNIRRATFALSKAGIKTTEDKVRGIRDRNPARYDEVRKQLADDIGKRIADSFEQTAMAATQVAADAVELTRTKVANGSVNNPAATARDMAAVAKDLSTQAALMRGQATSIVEVRSLEEILRSLEGKLPKPPHADAETTAEEEPPSNTQNRVPVLP